MASIKKSLPATEHADSNKVIVRFSDHLSFGITTKMFALVISYAKILVT